MITRWTILDKYPFELLPGEPRIMPGGDLSYYQYINKRWAETGKNVLCVSHLLEDFPEQLTYMDPFGGCGVFASAIINEKKPSRYYVADLDEECVAQLHHALDRYPCARVARADARESIDAIPADVFVLEFPFFTLGRYERGEWRDELERVLKLKPKALLLTDGASFFWQKNYLAFQKKGYPVTKDKASYVKVFSDILHSRYGYSISKVGWHGFCFYFLLEPGRHDFTMKYFAPGTGHKGLKPAS
jgi:hypothetical protein